MQSVYETPKTKAKMRQNLIDEFRTYSPKGQLYTADLPDEMVDRMLDWDKPLSEQSAAVKKVLTDNGFMLEENIDITGRELYNFLAKDNMRFQAPEGETAKEASKFLAQMGIPGIKYLDQGSRDQGSGTRNFVIFPGEEKKVKILKRE